MTVTKYKPYLIHSASIFLLLLFRYLIVVGMSEGALLTRMIEIAYGLTALILVMASVISKIGRMDSSSYMEFYGTPMTAREKLLLFYGVGMLGFQAIL